MSVLNSFTELMTPDAIGKLSQAVGVDRTQTQKGLDVIGPLLLGSLAKKSETVDGMDAIMRLLPEDTGGLMSKFMGAVGLPQALSSPRLLNSVLGPGASTIEKALDGRLGFNATSLLSVAAPAILGVIGSTAKAQKLNSADIARTLQQESSAAMAAARPEVKAVLTEAFQLSERAENLKASFSDAEWQNIRLSPVAATLYVASASPSGLRSLSKEIVAAGDAMKDIVKNALPTSLVDIAFSSFEGKLELDTESGLEASSPRSRMLAVIQEALRTIKAKRPVDATAFREAIVTLSRRVAEGAKEGGFMGIGGTLVSKEEEQALADIAAAIA